LLLLGCFSAALPGAAAPLPSSGKAYVYPCPVRPNQSARIVFAMRSPGEAEVRVYHEDGTLVERMVRRRPFGIQEEDLQTGRYAPGVYLYRVTLKYDTGFVEQLRSGWFTVAP
jgi:hypothetical protein